MNGNADTATSASHAVQADNATTATTANTASYVAGANVDGQVASASLAANATSASHAVQADSALTSTTSTTATTASYVEYSNVANKPTLISSSAQIASDISGSFTSTSASIATDIATNKTNIATNTSDISSLRAATGSYATTGSNTFNGNQVITGSVDITGSLTVDGDSLFNFKTAPNFTYKDIITFPSFTKSASPANGRTFGYNAFRYFNIPVAGNVNNTYMIMQADDASLTNYGGYVNVGGMRWLPKESQG